MPALIVSSRYTTDSQILRQTADRMGWITLRLDGKRIPDWFECEDSQIALFYTAPHAFEIAGQLSRTLVGCDPGWLLRLPSEFVRRHIRQMALAEALQLSGRHFVKHALSKAFPAKVYDAGSLAEATAKILPNCLVNVVEPVEWSVEYRCFVLDNKVLTISPYSRHGQIIQDHSSLLDAPQSEIDEAKRFADSVLEHPDVACPPAFVLDVGILRNQGWAVVEANECWASGIYACEPEKVLQALLRACPRSDTISDQVRRWDFKGFYFAACS